MAVRLSSFSILSNIGVRRMIFEYVGDAIETHAHDFAHTMLCVEGEVEVWSKGVEGNHAVLRPGEHFVVEAGVEHGARSLTERAQAVCVFAHRTPQGEVVQAFAGFYKAAN